jgi:hypothetical protein
MFDFFLSLFGFVARQDRSYMIAAERTKAFA